MTPHRTGRPFPVGGFVSIVSKASYPSGGYAEHHHLHQPLCNSGGGGDGASRVGVHGASEEFGYGASQERARRLQRLLAIRGLTLASSMGDRMSDQDPEPITAAKAPLGPVCRWHPTSGIVDVEIHNGRSTRRDCAECGKFVAFTRWYGNPSMN